MGLESDYDEAMETNKHWALVVYRPPVQNPELEVVNKFLDQMGGTSHKELGEDGNHSLNDHIADFDNVSMRCDSQSPPRSPPKSSKKKTALGKGGTSKAKPSGEPTAKRVKYVANKKKQVKEKGSRVSSRKKAQNEQPEATASQSIPRQQQKRVCSSEDQTGRMLALAPTK